MLALYIGLGIFLDIFMPRASNGWAIIFVIWGAMFSKFIVIDRFSKALDSGELENKGGVNPWGIYIPIVLIVICIIAGFILGFEWIYE